MRPRPVPFAISSALLSAALSTGDCRPALAGPDRRASPSATAGFPEASPSPAPPPASPPSDSPLAEPRPAPGWVRGFEAARWQLYGGDFAGAERSFDALARQATRDEDARLARELARLCGVFRERGVRLMPEPVPASMTPGVLEQSRTTDELAWLYLSAVAYGIGTGAWVATLTRPDTVAGAVLPALGLAGIAAGGVALADSRGALKYGVPQAISTGLELGLGEGIAWSLYNQAHVNSDREWKAATVATVMWSVATAGGIAGGTIGGLAGATPGRTSFVGSSGLWTATVAGLLTAGASGNDQGQRDDRGLLAAGIGINAGAIGGALVAGPMSPSVARVRFIDLGAIAGGLVAGGIYASASNGFHGPDEDGLLRGFYATTGAGIAAGFATAMYLTAGMAKDHGPERAAKTGRAFALHVEPTLLAARGGALLGAAGSF